MRKLYMGLMSAFVLMMAGCGDDGEKVKAVGEVAKNAVESQGCSPGYFFMLLLIVVPIFVVLVKLFRESEATSDSLISLEGQLRRLNNKIDDLEASVKGEKK